MFVRIYIGVFLHLKIYKWWPRTAYPFCTLLSPALHLQMFHVSGCDESRNRGVEMGASSLTTTSVTHWQTVGSLFPQPYVLLA